MLPILSEFYDLKVDFITNVTIVNILKVISSATGEPPLCMAVSVFFALRDAVNATRADHGDSEWYRMGKSVQNLK